MKRLEGKTVALVGQRKVEEISKIVENLGGIPLVRPAQGTIFLDDTHLEADIKELVKGNYNWFIFTTGVGTEILYKTADKLGLADEFLSSLKAANIAARGYKTVNMLKKLGVTPTVRDDDGSTAGLVRALHSFSFEGKHVALQLHGDPAPKLIDFLSNQKAQFKEILPYQHIPPKAEIMEQLINELISGKIDAVNFTSAPQARFLFSFAREHGQADHIRELFKSSVVAVSVGKVTAAALKEEGVDRIVIPDQERMGSAIVALEHYYQQRD
ncbi:uroporphyrinogen-III synthase [Bacillus sp. ILBB4]|nr:uroporphyrinogen-III synthase [Bacillus sp. ILBB4]